MGRNYSEWFDYSCGDACDFNEKPCSKIHRVRFVFHRTSDVYYFDFEDNHVKSELFAHPSMVNAMIKSYESLRNTDKKWP